MKSTFLLLIIIILTFKMLAEVALTRLKGIPSSICEVSPDLSSLQYSLFANMRVFCSFEHSLIHCFQQLARIEHSLCTQHWTGW